LQNSLISIDAVIEVSQQIAYRDRTVVTKITGTVVKIEQAETGAWWAHAHHAKLWLDRVTLKMDDGELTDLILDQYSHVKLLGEEK